MNRIKFENGEMEYELRRTAKKNVNIRINKDARLCVSAPKFVSLKEIEDFLHSKEKWILKSIESMKKKISNRKENVFLDNGIVWYKGLDYKVKIIEKKRNNVSVIGDTFFFEVKKEFVNNQEYIRALYDKWLASEAKVLYSNMIEKFRTTFDNYEIEKPNLQVRKMKSRWGSCIPKKNKIILNTNMMYAPLCCSEYVVLHELTHMIEFSHNKRFYDIIESIMIDWKERQSLLNNDFGSIV